MFAIPGILGILLFIYLRPQEAFAPLQGVPFLYLFFALILFGAAVDLRLRVTKAIPIPALPWAAAFLVWCLISVAINKPDQLMPSAIQLFITIAIFVLVAQSIQSFQIFEKVAAMLIALGMVLTLIAIHQSRAPLTCVIAPAGEGNHNETGTPTGIPCVKARSCYTDAKDPSVDYYCERVGVLGTHSIGKRVRYRGVLQDPNELAIALTSGLALLIALWIRTRKRRWKWAALIGVVLVAWAVKETGSRSGQLGFLATLGAFLFWKYRWKLAIVAGPMMVPLLLLVAKGGSDRSDAASSSTERYEAWLAGLEMFRQSPIWGIGFGLFNGAQHADLGLCRAWHRWHLSLFHAHLDHDQDSAFDPETLLRARRSSGIGDLVGGALGFDWRNPRGQHVPLLCLSLHFVDLHGACRRALYCGSQTRSRVRRSHQFHRCCGGSDLQCHHVLRADRLPSIEGDLVKWML